MGSEPEVSSQIANKHPEHGEFQFILLTTPVMSLFYYPGSAFVFSELDNESKRQHQNKCGKPSPAKKHCQYPSTHLPLVKPSPPFQVRETPTHIQLALDVPGVKLVRGGEVRKTIFARKGRRCGQANRSPCGWSVDAHGSQERAQSARDCDSSGPCARVDGDGVKTAGGHAPP